jgi:hypothetical protein
LHEDGAAKLAECVSELKGFYVKTVSTFVSNCISFLLEHTLGISFLVEHTFYSHMTHMLDQKSKAQIVSTRADLFPKQYTDALSGFTDNLDPMPGSMAKGTYSTRSSIDATCFVVQGR